MDSSPFIRDLDSFRCFALGICLLAAVASAQAPLTEPPVSPPAEASASFIDLALRVDAKNHITEGRLGKPVSHREFFTLLERADLLAALDARAQRRTWLIVGAVAVGAVAITVGTILLATSPVLASPACESDVRVYNEICVPRLRLHTASGTATIATGVVLSLVMAGFAYGSDQVMISRDETESMVARYNADLARRLKGAPQGFRVLPVVSPDGAGLVAGFRF